jgi:hypothetical protein
MKTITSLLAATMLIAGAASAMADQQRSDEAVDYALSRQATRGDIGGAYASVPREQDVRGSAATFSRHTFGNDFGNDRNIIDFQETGSH